MANKKKILNIIRKMVASHNHPFIQGTDGLPFKLTAAGKELTHVGIRDKDRPEGIITFVEGPEGKESFKQPLTLDVNINRIGKVAGSWKGEIHIDPTKLKVR